MGCLTSVDFEASGWSLAGSRGSRRGFFAGFVRGVRSRGWFVRGRGSFAGLVRPGLVRVCLWVV